jgi:lysyl-tRNA synthetase class 2
MTDSSIRRLSKLKERIVLRSRIIGAVRNFFIENSFLEVETPLRDKSPLPEVNIEALCSENLFLRTSPEPYLKALLSAGYEKIFEIGPCFRKNESGRLHREEFTMLEWYQAGASSRDLIPFTKKMLLHAAKKTTGTTKIQYKDRLIDLDAEWEIVKLKDAFAKFAGRSLAESTNGNFFELDLLEKIEPNLPNDRPVILSGYPAKFRAYSALSADDPEIADRWELYIGGMEIANTCTELVEKGAIEETLRIFADERKSKGMKEYPENQIFRDAVAAGIPKSAGCALGLDRLVMLLTNSHSIEDIKI